MEEAEREKTRFLVSRRGKPKVVILSVEDYLKNVVKQPEILATIQLSVQKAGLDTVKVLFPKAAVSQKNPACLFQNMLGEIQVVSVFCFLENSGIYPFVLEESTHQNTGIKDGFKHITSP